MSAKPGTELKRILSTIHINPSAACSCNQRANSMDLLGPRWCLLNIETIVDWLEEAAESLPEQSEQLGDKFDRAPAKRIALIAIRRSVPVEKRSQLRRDVGVNWLTTISDNVTESLLVWFCNTVRHWAVTRWLRGTA